MTYRCPDVMADSRKDSPNFGLPGIFCSDLRFLVSLFVFFPKISFAVLGLASIP